MPEITRRTFFGALGAAASVAGLVQRKRPAKSVAPPAPPQVDQPPVRQTSFQPNILGIALNSADKGQPVQILLSGVVPLPVDSVVVVVRIADERIQIAEILNRQPGGKVAPVLPSAEVLEL